MEETVVGINLEKHANKKCTIDKSVIGLPRSEALQALLNWTLTLTYKTLAHWALFYDWLWSDE